MLFPKKLGLMTSKSYNFNASHRSPPDLLHHITFQEGKKSERESSPKQLYPSLFPILCLKEIRAYNFQPLHLGPVPNRASPFLCPSVCDPGCR
jgi:hypothetical protein